MDSHSQGWSGRISEDVIQEISLGGRVWGRNQGDIKSAMSRLGMVIRALRKREIWAGVISMCMAAEAKDVNEISQEEQRKKRTENKPWMISGKDRGNKGVSNHYNAKILDKGKKQSMMMTVD